MIFEAITELIAIPPIIIPVGRVARYFILINEEPIIPLNSIVTTGGVSSSQIDKISQILKEHGEIGFWRLAIKPGRPLAFGKFGNTPFIGLPGNPVASIVTFFMLVIDYVKKLSGNNNTEIIERLLPNAIRTLPRKLKVGIQTVVGPAISSLLFLAVFTLALGRSVNQINNINLSEFIAPGLIMMTMLQNSFANAASSIGQSKFQGNIVDILMAPLSDLELASGYILGAIARGLICGIVTFIGIILVKT